MIGVAIVAVEYSVYMTECRGHIYIILRLKKSEKMVMLAIMFIKKLDRVKIVKRKINILDKQIYT